MHFADRLRDRSVNSLRELYDESLDTGKPIYVRYISSLSHEHTYWECLILPLSSDGRGKPTFAFNHLARLSDKADVLQVLFDRSLIGMLAAVPITYVLPSQESDSSSRSLR